eukprot:GEMP01079009.1.p2 GENE.GEMP01079009.1~~GEMP01079009.1.p2  ORF type:complete len:100 (-),score=3.65 GEMP01079009.1:349-648(-)
MFHFVLGAQTKNSLPLVFFFLAVPAPLSLTSFVFVTHIFESAFVLTSEFNRGSIFSSVSSYIPPIPYASSIHSNRHPSTLATFFSLPISSASVGGGSRR